MIIAIFIHAILFLVFWLTNLSFQKTLNEFLVGAIGYRADYLLLFMIFAGLVALWSAARLLLRQNARRAGPTWLYLAIGTFFLIFFYGSFIVLFLKNPVQLYRVGQLLQYFRIFIDAGILLILAWYIPGWVKIKSMQNVLPLVILLVLWMIPVIMPPGNVYRSAMPEKPLLIAHRGTTDLEMENTLGSMMGVRIFDIYGIETDITISSDGMLFLMHDATLERTTNVETIFPGRENESAGSFTWDELSQLEVIPADYGDLRFPDNSIPTLAETVQFIRDNNLHFIYDLRIPTADQPYADVALTQTLEEIRNAGITNQTWILATPAEIPAVQAVLPDAILARGIGYTDVPPAPDSLLTDGYQIVNSAYGLSLRRIRAYQDAGMWVNLWVVDEPWQYSRLWLAGTDSVTSNNAQTFCFMSRPLMAMPYTLYLAIWGMVGIIAAGICAVKLKRAR